ncbi:putative MFS family arabinose efflux permease [Arthrobacter woluwensis]|uniref:MFS transporter n=1 Tax=Arthrobacter woluwensis TaxID=156980 RepID=UPI0027825EAC|nr:MFS transporter [Arthrobacter woluwensis]MDQ0708732.1 putative MFS family arabinose efflux permease [Arthrobacter woluwensis]
MPPDSTTAPERHTSGHAPHAGRWGGVFALSFGAFALVASEFMPVSLLTPMASDLQVSEGMIGQGIAISGLFAVLTSLSLSTLIRSQNRRTLLISLAALMGVSGALISLASGYAPFMIGRAFIGIVIGGFWSMSAATAMRLVPAARVTRALAIVNGGNALATVLAAPLGSYLGSIIGWRGAFFCLVPVSLICIVWLWFSLPSLEVPPAPTGAPPPGLRDIFVIFTLLRNRSVAWGMAACGAYFMGQFILFTYIRPFLETVTRIDVTAISVVLLVLGASGFLGTVLIGRFLGRGLYRTLAVIPTLMAVLAVVLIPTGGWFAAVVILLALWGLLSTAAPVGWWSWVAEAMPRNAELGGGLMVATVQTCIALGSTVGGLLFDHSGYQSTFLASAVVLILAAVLALVTARVSPQPTAA